MPSDHQRLYLCQISGRKIERWGEKVPRSQARLEILYKTKELPYNHFIFYENKIKINYKNNIKIF